MEAADTESTGTSIDDTENFCDNPTRDALAEGLMGLIKPTVDQLDESVKSTRIAQLQLRQSIDRLTDELRKISEARSTTDDLEKYMSKLVHAKNRVTVLTNVLQNSEDRLNKVHRAIEKETLRRSMLLQNTGDSSKQANSDTQNVA